MRKFSRAGGTAAAVIALAVIPAAFAAAPAGGSVRVRGPAQRAAVSWPTRIQPAAPALPAGRGRIHPSAATADVTSNRWGGYAATGKGARFRFVRAAFFVPYADCVSTPGSASADWLGLDGFSNQTVEGTGIFAVCNGATPEYRAWFVLSPTHTVYPNITIGPGQSIVASVYYSSAARKFTFSLTDTTNGHHFSRSRGCPSGFTCARMSAEVNTQTFASSAADRVPLTNFRAEGFSGVEITDQAGRRSGLRSASWQTYKLTTVNYSGAILDQPTSLLRGTAFSNYWLRSG